MMNLRNLFILGLASTAFAFAGCDDDDDATAQIDDGADAGGQAGSAGSNESGSAGTGGESGSDGSEICEQNTKALGSPSEFGPATRLTTFNIPKTPELAQAAGCQLVTTAQGTQFRDLILNVAAALDTEVEEDFDLSIVFTPNENNYISAIVLAALNDWHAGQTANQAGKSSLSFYVGQHNAERSLTNFNIDPVSYVGLNPSNAQQIRFENADLTCAQLRSEPSTISASVPIMGVDLSIDLLQSVFQGGLEASGDGFNLTSATLSGYISRETLAQLIDQAKIIYNNLCPTSCTQKGNTKESCDEICEETLYSLFTSETEQLVDLGISFAGGFDAYLEGTTASAACSSNDQDTTKPACNAIGFCFEFASEAVTIDSVAPQTRFSILRNN